MRTENCQPVKDSVFRPWNVRSRYTEGTAIGEFRVWSQLTRLRRSRGIENTLQFQPQPSAHYIYYKFSQKRKIHHSCPHSLPLRCTEPGPNSRLALSHQLKKRGSQDIRNISKTETGSYHDSMDDPWCPSDRSWTKDSVGDVFKVLSISETGRDVSRSQRTFQITDKHV